MCGIAGYFGSAHFGWLQQMSQAIAHRGPDGEGIWFDESQGIGLAHRRLAIIDPTEAAAQPMPSCGGRYQVVFNGEIYNFHELAGDLKSAGYQFNQNSDTAILGPLYDRYGPDCLEKLNGIFAFAIWDTHNRELFLARDGLGVKPLYFTEIDGGLAFASELKALAKLLPSGAGLDETALLSYLTRLWSPGRNTPFRDVKKLLPGHYISARRGDFSIHAWRRPKAGGAAIRGSSQLSLNEAIDEVRSTFDRAVGRQCLSDVPIGAFLSGGVDSSAIVTSMIATGNAPQQTYCIGFDQSSMIDEGFGDDLSYARLIADQCGVPLSVINVREPEPEDLEALPFMLDEPTADPAALFVAGIAKQASADGIKVLLGGTGGDDIFSGYRRHRAAAMRSRFGAISRLLPMPSSSGRGALNRRLAKLAYLCQGTDEQFLLRAFEFNRHDDALAVLAPEVRARLTAIATDHLEEALAASAGRPLVERMLDLELHGFLPDHNLNYTDKASMLHGVEVRVPFLDNELVDVALRIPWQMKTRGLQEKWILKRALEGRLPNSLLHRKKTGFGGPVRMWLAKGKLRQWAEDLLSSKRFLERGLFDGIAVRQLLDDTISGRRDGAYLVLAVLMIELWQRSFCDEAAMVMAEQEALAS